MTTQALLQQAADGQARALRCLEKLWENPGDVAQTQRLRDAARDLSAAAVELHRQAERAAAEKHTLELPLQ